jgi:hypothetical protein
MTADEKIKESEYNFNELKNTDKLSEVFNYKFNSFITSSRSILDYLLDDYISKFNLKIPLNTKDLKAEFHKQAKSNSNAKRFIDWYEGAYSNIVKNLDYGFLMKKRNTIIHRESIKPDQFRIGIEFPRSFTASSNTETIMPLTINHNSNTVKISNINKTTKEEKEIEVKAKAIHEPFLAENHKQPIETICRLFLDEIEKVVKYAQSNF